MTCRNCFTNDETGKQSPTTSCSRVKQTALSACPTVEEVGPSDNSKLMSLGTRQKDLNSSIDRSHKAACSRQLPARPPHVPNLTGGSLLLTTRHSTGKQRAKL